MFGLRVPPSLPRWSFFFFFSLFYMTGWKNQRAEENGSSLPFLPTLPFLREEEMKQEHRPLVLSSSEDFLPPPHFRFSPVWSREERKGPLGHLPFPQSWLRREDEVGQRSVGLCFLSFFRGPPFRGPGTWAGYWFFLPIRGSRGNYRC